MLTALVCLSLCIFCTASVAAAETLTVGPGGNFSRIQQAISAASPGDTILVYSGTYKEDLSVDKQVTLKGADQGTGKPVVFGTGNGDVITITADGVRLEGFEVRNSEKYAAAIQVMSDDNVITENKVTGCNEGIRLDHANRNLIHRNTLIDNRGDGIYIHYSDDNTVTDNHAENNEFGIHGESMRGTVIKGNTCKDNSQIDVYVENIADSVIGDNRIEDNEEASNNGGDGIGMRYGTNVTIHGNYVGKHYYGIKVYYSDNVAVTNNTVEDSGVNVRYDFGTRDSSIRFNTVTNGIDNILLGGDSTNNLVEYNTVSVGKDSIYLFGAGSGNTITHNNVYDSTYGVRLYKSTGNTITDNYLHDNEDSLYPDGTGNTVSNNKDRANFFGPDSAQVSPSPTATAAPTGTGTPTTTPGTGTGQQDIISWILGIIHGLFS